VEGQSQARQLIYRNYDQAELDAQYTNATQAPGGDPEFYFAQYREASARARSRFESRLDVAYGPGEMEKLDLFPASAAGAPTWIYIHGGFWRRLDKADSSLVASGLVPAGVSVVCINYALAPAVSVAEIVRQCREATRWTLEHVAEWDGAPERVFVGGHSVGGHLAGTVAASHPVAGVASISGVHDLEPVFLSYVNDWARLRRDEIVGLSPIHNLPPRPLPLLAAVGTLETDEFRRQNTIYAEAWRTRGYPVTEMVLEGLNHFTITLELGDPESSLTRALVSQMQTALT
jgi:arylformamidase